MRYQDNIKAGEDWERRDGSELASTRSGKGYKPGGRSHMRDDLDLA